MSDFYNKIHYDSNVNTEKSSNTSSKAFFDEVESIQNIDSHNTDSNPWRSKSLIHFVVALEESALDTVLIGLIGVGLCTGSAFATS